jgi:hypothetical protein
MSEDSSDPMHIHNVRAGHAADGAERDMLRAIGREVDPQPRSTPVGLVLRALRDDEEE